MNLEKVRKVGVDDMWPIYCGDQGLLWQWLEVNTWSMMGQASQELS